MNWSEGTVISGTETSVLLSTSRVEDLVKIDDLWTQKSTNRLWSAMKNHVGRIWFIVQHNNDPKQTVLCTKAYLDRKTHILTVITERLFRLCWRIKVVLRNFDYQAHYIVQTAWHTLCSYMFARFNKSLQLFTILFCLCFAVLQTSALSLHSSNIGHFAFSYLQIYAWITRIRLRKQWAVRQ